MYSKYTKTSSKAKTGTQQRLSVLVMSKVQYMYEPKFLYKTFGSWNLNFNFQDFSIYWSWDVFKNYNWLCCKRMPQIDPSFLNHYNKLFWKITFIYGRQDFLWHWYNTLTKSRIHNTYRKWNKSWNWFLSDPVTWISICRQ